MGSSFSKRLATLFFLALLFAWVAPALAQEPIEPIVAPEGIPADSDWLYRQHYDQVQEIMKTPDLAQRANQLEHYMSKCPPEAKILQYMEGFFGQIVREMANAGKNAEAAALTDKMRQLFPNSTALAGQAFQAAFQSGDYAKAIELGEKLYASNPDPQIGVILAQSYIATKNAAKAEEYSLKALETLGTEKGVYFAVWLADYYAGQGKTDLTMKYYQDILGAYPDSPPQGWNADAWNQIKVKSYLLQGSSLYAQKDHKGAIAAFEKVAKIQPKNDTAYLYIGLSHWQLQELDQAMDSFAKAVVIGGGASAKARQYLEQIYKPRNGDSLEGLDKLLDKAKTELGA